MWRRRQTRQLLALPHVAVAFGYGLGVERFEVKGRELVAEPSERLGQPFVGRPRVGPHRVAAGRRHDHRAQQRCHGRAVHERDVRVPEVGPVLGAIDGMDLLPLEDLGFHRMALGQLAETSSEGDLGAVVELLVGEKTTRCSSHI